jgi:hypothetical protein
MGVAPESGGSYRRERSWHRWHLWLALPLLAVVGLVGGGIVALDSVVGASDAAKPQEGWGVVYPTPRPPRTVDLDDSIRPLVDRFIQTAVARKHLSEAYWFSGPEVREGMTLREWLSGNIAVVPFPVDEKTKATYTVVYSYAARAQLQVYLATPGRVVKNSPHTFFADVIKRNGRWFVDGWVPEWTPPIPTA